MAQTLTRLAMQFISEPLISQRIEGTVRLRFWAQSVDPIKPATWALSIRLVSKDGNEERGHLLPFTTGSESDAFGPELEPRIVGPLTLVPLDACDGDRIVTELGSLGAARIETRDDKQTWIWFSDDIMYEDLCTALDDDQRSRKVGKCIYCDRIDGPLSLEHIIPEGLNGQATLTDASCASCREITSRFEWNLLRDAFGPARIALRMRTKRPAERPRDLPIQVRRGGTESSVRVPVKDYPAMISLPIFAPPGYLSQDSTQSGLVLKTACLIQLAGPPFTEVYAKSGYEYTGIRLSYGLMEFARAVAKIAYGFAVLKLGLKRISEAFVLPAILGKAADIGRWVGCDPGAPHGPTTGLHALAIRIDRRDKEIHVFVKLFAQFGAPEYHVVVGRVR